MSETRYAWPRCRSTLTLSFTRFGVFMLVGICFFPIKPCLSMQAARPPRTRTPRKTPRSEKEREELLQAIRKDIANRPKAEPLPRPELWTALEYQMALNRLESQWLKNPTPEKATYLVEVITIHLDAREIYPRAAEVVEREGLKQINDRNPSPDALDRMVFRHPSLRLLKSKDVRKTLGMRAAWKERKAAYNKLRAITGDKREWSLLHHFDDLDRESMKKVLLSAQRGQEKGSEALSVEDLVLLAAADQLEFLAELYRSPEEIRQAKAEKERKRLAAEEAVRQQRQREVEARRKAEKEAKEEAAREVVRKADLEKKGLPYYPRPRTMANKHNAEEWYQMLQENPRNERMNAQATAALRALKEEGIPFLLDHLSHQTTPKARDATLRLIRVEYIHRNDLHKLLPCLERKKNFQGTRFLALQWLEKRAKDLKKDLVPQIESRVGDMLDNPKYKEETKEEIRSWLKTIRREATSQSANLQP